MKVVLIWPKGMDGLFPLAMGYLANAARSVSDEIQVSILDCTLNVYSPKYIRDVVKDADLSAISVWGYNLKNVNEHISYIKSVSSCLIVAGGPSAHLADSDFYIAGEGERAFFFLTQCLYKNESEKISSIVGVTRKGQELKFPKEFITNLDSLGYINYKELSLKEYLEHGHKDWMYSLKDKAKSAPIMTTRGCPYSCAYCQGPIMMGHKIRKHSIEYVINTIIDLYENYDIRQISFLDDNLTFHLEYAKTLCNEIIKLKEANGWNIVFTTLNGVRVNRMDEELIMLMKKAGWAEIVISPESGSPHVLKLMNKKLDVVDMEKKIDLIHKHRMNVVGYFLAGYPGETREDLELSKNYILKSNLDRCILNFFNPTPGTPAYDEALSSPTFNSNINYKAIGYITKDLTAEDLLAFRDAIKEKTIFKEKWIKDL